MEEGLLEKTGKPLSHWIEVVKKSKLEKHGEILKMLKSDHAFTHGFANFVALKARKADAGSMDDADLLVNQYKGKEELKPIYNHLKSILEKLGEDVKITPKKDSVSFIRNKQFVLVKPATKTRIDLGLKIKGQEPSGKLEGSGPFGTMCTHRIKLESIHDVDDEVKSWIEKAYALN